jgi:arylsulfatase A-like enzyme
MIWKAPGVTRENAICQRAVDFSSIYPTLCDLAGLPKPTHLDGKSIVSLLRDPATPWDQPAITTHGRMNHAIRSQQYRYIRYENGDQELYDTLADPLEYTNLADSDKHQSVIEELAQWIPKVNADNLPSPRRNAGQRNNPRRKPNR